MDMLNLGIALMLPWLAGCLWARLAFPPGSPGALTAILGYGYLGGVLITGALIFLVDALGLGLNFHLIAGLMLLLAIPAWWLPRRLPWLQAPARPAAATTPVRLRPDAATVAMALLLILLLLRFANYAVEILSLPLYPWDAWMNWAPKGRVWLEHGQLVPFVSPGEWLHSDSPTDYTGSTGGNWAYPPLVPMMQLWVALAIADWNESLINLPWLSCALALVLACHGQLRILGASPLFALVVCHLLASMPFVGTHVMLAGYAELWIAAFLGLGAMAFLNWLQTREPRQALLALLIIAGLPFIKNPGIIWALCFIPALLVGILPLWMLAMASVLILGVLLALYLAGGIALNLPGIEPIIISPGQVIMPGFSGPGFQFYPVWDPFIQNFFVLANWHLFWFLVPLLLIFGLSRIRDRASAAALCLALTGLAFLFLIFFFTHRYSQWALDYTTLNRAVMHPVPAMMFIGAFLILRARQRHPNRQMSDPAA